jgi:hypothetical protein
VKKTFKKEELVDAVPIGDPRASRDTLDSREIADLNKDFAKRLVGGNGYGHERTNHLKATWKVKTPKPLCIMWPPASHSYRLLVENDDKTSCITQGHGKSCLTREFNLLYSLSNKKFI